MHGSIGPKDNQRNSIMSVHDNISIKNNESISKGIGSSQRNGSYKVNLLTNSNDFGPFSKRRGNNNENSKKNIQQLRL